MSKYELSRTVKSYEHQRESLAFAIHQKIYKAQDEGPGLYCNGFYAIVAKKDLRKYLSVIDKEYDQNITMSKFSNLVEKIQDIPLFAEESITASRKASEHYILKVGRLALRKATIDFLTKRGCQKIESATNEKQYTSGFVLTYGDVDALFDHIKTKLYGYNGTDEENFNSLIKKLPKSFYTLDQEKCDITLDPKLPIKFTNVIDDNDWFKAGDNFLGHIGRIKVVFQEVAFREENDKAKIIWFL